MDVRPAGTLGLTLVALGLWSGSASAETYHAAPVADEGALSGGACTAVSPCWPDDAIEWAVASNDGPTSSSSRPARAAGRRARGGHEPQT